MSKGRKTADSADTQPPQGDPGLRGDALLIALLAAGYSQSQAAQRAGVSARTIARRQADPEFVAQVQRAKATTVEQVTARLTAASLRAVDALLRLLDSRSEMARLGAARSVLEMAAKYREGLELEQRIAALEARIEQPGGRPRWAS